jgi:tRNA 2-thiouridine synthesizing protein A
MMMDNEQTPDAEWDAGDMGCGELVLALRMRMHNLPFGGLIKVTALDPGAPEDLPAWCRMTGHTLVQMNHPHYFIRRKES